MSKDFLSRWSRRKLAAAQAPETAEPPPHAENSPAPEHATETHEPEPCDLSGAAPNAADPRVPAFDPASLPAIESITAETDIRGFFAAGVPAELTRAALRRVWASDPKIRDFVGLADYDWDFNTPGSMAGFGPIEAADALRREVGRLMVPNPVQPGIRPERPEPGPQATPGTAASGDSIQNQNRPGQFDSITTKAEPPPHVEESRNFEESRKRDELTQPDGQQNTAAQQQEKPEADQSIGRRRHGRALPES